MTSEMLCGILVYGMLAIITAILASMSVSKKFIHIRGISTLLCVFIPSLIAGLRFNIGTDYVSYYYQFEKIRLGFETKLQESLIYVLINKIVSDTGGSYQVLLFVLALINTIFIYAALRRYKDKLNIGLAMFIYMITYYQMSYNIIRQIVALSILLYSIEFISERKIFKYTICILIAMGFHTSAIIFYPLYFLKWIYGESNHNILRMVSFIILIMISTNFSEILFPILVKFDSISYYVRNYLYSTSEFKLEIGFFIRTLPLLIPGIIFWKDIKKEKSILLNFNIMIIGCILLLSAYSADNYTERISYYFLSTQIIVVPYIYRKSTEVNKGYIGLLLVFSIIVLWYVDFIYMGRNETVPYRWIL